MLVKAEEFISDRANRQSPKRLKKLPASVVAVGAATPVYTGRGNAFKNTRTGYRADIAVNCRSGWEANFLRVLKSYNIPFEFEPMIFYFPVKRGTKAYTPDVFLKNTGEWVELKGYFDQASRIKIKRFKKYYPDQFAVLTLIISKSSKLARAVCEELEVPTVLFYEDLSHSFREKISNWEGK